jgi:hypothetical protein
VSRWHENCVRARPGRCSEVGSPAVGIVDPFYGSRIFEPGGGATTAFECNGAIRWRRRKQANRIWVVVIVMASVGALSFVLSCVRELAAWTWLRTLSQFAGVCDGVTFFGLIYWQLANDRTAILEPMQDAAEENRLLLQHIESKHAGIERDLCGMSEQLVHIANTHRLADRKMYMDRVLSKMESAIRSKPHQPKPVLRLMRLSGHWRRNERLQRAAELLAKFFDTGNAAGPWSDQWEVKMLYAVADKETLNALLDQNAVLGKILRERPKNCTFRLLRRNLFEPSIGVAIIGDEVAFVGFDESTDDPFPDQGLEIHGDAVGWYITWFEEMFENECAVNIYERGNPAHTLIDDVRKTLHSNQRRDAVGKA